MKFAIGKCKNANCKYFHGHGCPVPLPVNRVDSQHQAAPQRRSSCASTAEAQVPAVCPFWACLRLAFASEPCRRESASGSGSTLLSERMDLLDADTFASLKRLWFHLVLLSAVLQVLVPSNTPATLGVSSGLKVRCRTHAPIAACAHSAPAHRSWSFFPIRLRLFSSVGLHTALSRRRSADCPDSLAPSLAKIAAPFLDKHEVSPSLRSWTCLLPSAACWAPPTGRVEDGAGRCSETTPFLCKRPGHRGCLTLDFTLSLRTARLLSGSKSDPATPEEFEPFLSDLRAFLHAASDATGNLSSGSFQVSLFGSTSGALISPKPNPDCCHLLRQGVLLWCWLSDSALQGHAPSVAPAQILCLWFMRIHLEIRD